MEPSPQSQAPEASPVQASQAQFAHAQVAQLECPPLLSVVVPCYNEEAVLETTHARLRGTLDHLAGLRHEIVYVDDGSRDRTGAILAALAAADPCVRVVRFSRNFGHQVAVTAGIEHAAGDAVVLIDADLQDPPEVIAEFVARWREGYHVAYGLRTGRAGETRFKLWTAKLFYRGINRMSETVIPVDTGDFRLMDRKVVDALLAMPEHDRFVRGMVSWVGFRQVAVPYRRAERLAGETKYPVRKMLRFALDGITSFSLTPLTLATYAGFVTSGLAVLGILYALVLRLFTHYYVTGWTALFIAVLFLGGIQLTALGIMGQYVGRIYREAKRRPLYFVQERLGFARDALAALRPAETAEAAVPAAAPPGVERRERRGPVGDRRRSGERRRSQDRRGARPQFVVRRA
jgi:dolichol-phosphate mannosyltransferase